jgi:hypothetical protein
MSEELRYFEYLAIKKFFKKFIRKKKRETRCKIFINLEIYNKKKRLYLKV